MTGRGASPRRVVTGHDSAGRSRIERDDGPAFSVEAEPGGPVFHEIWRSSDPALGVAFSESGADARLTLGPPPRGSRIRIMDIPPEAEPMTAEAAARHFEAIGGAHALSIDPDAPHPLMHRTTSIDYALILEGELTLILDAEETRLTAGDVVVQRGTNHAWANRGPFTCRVAFILIDQTGGADA